MRASVAGPACSCGSRRAEASTSRAAATTMAGAIGPPSRRGASRTDDDVDVAVEQMEERDELTQALAALADRAGDRAAARRCGAVGRALAGSAPSSRALPRLDRELVDQEVGQIARVLVVLEGLLDVHGAFRAGVENVGGGFASELLVDVDAGDAVVAGGSRIEAREGDGRIRPERSVSSRWVFRLLTVTDLIFIAPLRRRALG